MRLRNRVALVTGAGMGIGKATAVLFAQEGARVVAADVNEEAGVATAEEIQQAGGDCFFQRTDVSSEPDVKAIVRAASARYGAIDILMNVAGIAHESPHTCCASRSGTASSTST